MKLVAAGLKDAIIQQPTLFTRLTVSLSFSFHSAIFSVSKLFFFFLIISLISLHRASNNINCVELNRTKLSQQQAKESSSESHFQCLITIAVYSVHYVSFTHVHHPDINAFDR